MEVTADKTKVRFQWDKNAVTFYVDKVAKSAVVREAESDDGFAKFEASKKRYATASCPAENADKIAIPTEVIGTLSVEYPDKLQQAYDFTQGNVCVSAREIKDGKLNYLFTWEEGEGK